MEGRVSLAISLPSLLLALLPLGAAGALALAAALAARPKHGIADGAHALRCLGRVLRQTIDGCAAACCSGERARLASDEPQASARERGPCRSFRRSALAGGLLGGRRRFGALAALASSSCRRSLRARRRSYDWGEASLHAGDSRRHCRRSCEHRFGEGQRNSHAACDCHETVTRNGRCRRLCARGGSGRSDRGSHAAGAEGRRDSHVRRSGDLSRPLLCCHLLSRQLCRSDVRRRCCRYSGCFSGNPLLCGAAAQVRNLLRRRRSEAGPDFRHARQHCERACAEDGIRQQR